MITTATGRTTVRSQTSGLLWPLSADCVGIASGAVLPVAQWMWYVYVFSGSAQTGRTSSKCLFVRGFMVCTVHRILFRWSTFWSAKDLSASPELTGRTVRNYCIGSSFLLSSQSVLPVYQLYWWSQYKGCVGIHKLIKRSKIPPVTTNTLLWMCLQAALVVTWQLQNGRLWRMLLH